MTDLTEDLMKHFKAETAWRPGLGLWIGETVDRLFGIEKMAARERNLRIDAGIKITELEMKIEKMAAAERARAFKPVSVGGCPIDKKKKRGGK